MAVTMCQVITLLTEDIILPWPLLTEVTRAQPAACTLPRQDDPEDKVCEEKTEAWLNDEIEEMAEEPCLELWWPLLLHHNHHIHYNHILGLIYKA